MLSILAFILATAFPSTSQTAWMRPESFHLTIGMSRSAAVKTLQNSGWKTQQGDVPTQLIVDYSPTRSLTLDFHNDRLRSVRFELFTIVGQAASAFEEERAFLRRAFGEPKPVKLNTMLVYDSMLPNIMAIVSNDPKSDAGRKGLGVLVVRYYDPVPGKK